jgi:hypothetical protein
MRQFLFVLLALLAIVAFTTVHGDDDDVDAKEEKDGPEYYGDVDDGGSDTGNDPSDDEEEPEPYDPDAPYIAFDTSSKDVRRYLQDPYYSDDEDATDAGSEDSRYL